MKVGALVGLLAVFALLSLALLSSPRGPDFLSKFRSFPAPPAYPTAYDLSQHDGEWGHTTYYSTDDSVEKVEQFYRDKLPEQGWKRTEFAKGSQEEGCGMTEVYSRSVGGINFFLLLDTWTDGMTRVEIVVFKEFIPHPCMKS